jgi:hypothetical protein
MSDAGPRAFGFATYRLLHPIIRNDILGAAALIIDFLGPGCRHLQKGHVQIEKVPNASGENPVGAGICRLKARTGSRFDFLPVLPKERHHLANRVTSTKAPEAVQINSERVTNQVVGRVRSVCNGDCAVSAIEQGKLAGDRSESELGSFVVGAVYRNRSSAVVERKSVHAARHYKIAEWVGDKDIRLKVVPSARHGSIVHRHISRKG